MTRPVGGVADEQAQFLNFLEFIGDGLESAEREGSQCKMGAHGLAQQWPNGIGEVRFTVVNDVVRHFPDHPGMTWDSMESIQMTTRTMAGAPASLARFGRPMFIGAPECLSGAQSGQDARAPCHRPGCPYALYPDMMTTEMMAGNG